MVLPFPIVVEEAEAEDEVFDPDTNPKADDALHAEADVETIDAMELAKELADWDALLVLEITKLSVLGKFRRRDEY